MSNKATIPELNELHRLIAVELAKKIKSGEFTAADLNVARQFLKDNGIEAVAVAGSPLDTLQKSVATDLPFPAEGISH